jgi:predicted phage gp36 major capsid-like protein
MDIDTHAELETQSYETKSGIPLGGVVTYAEMMRAFEAFKETNDQRLALTEKKSGDVLVEEKLSRINTTLDSQARRLDDIALKGARPALGGDRYAAPAIAGGKASLMTFPVIEAEDMPDVAANSLPIAFGDFNRGYLVVDRAGVSVLRDPYTAKPYVLFYTTKRVGGGVQDFDAIKLMKMAVS